MLKLFLGCSEAHHWRYKSSITKNGWTKIERTTQKIKVHALISLCTLGMNTEKQETKPWCVNIIAVLSEGMPVTPKQRSPMSTKERMLRTETFWIPKEKWKTWINWTREKYPSCISKIETKSLLSKQELQNLELAVLCSAITFFRLRRQNELATFGSL